MTEWSGQKFTNFYPVSSLLLKELVKMSSLNSVLSVHESSTELHLLLLPIFAKVLLMVERKVWSKKDTEVMSEKI